MQAWKQPACRGAGSFLFKISSEKSGPQKETASKQGAKEKLYNREFLTIVRGSVVAASSTHSRPPIYRVEEKNGL